LYSSTILSSSIEQQQVTMQKISQMFFLIVLLLLVATIYMTEAAAIAGDDSRGFHNLLRAKRLFSKQEVMMQSDSSCLTACSCEHNCILVELSRIRQVCYVNILFR
jgi:hypothetical protein